MMKFVHLLPVLTTLALSLGGALSYETGKTYRYDYATDLEISDPSSGDDWSSDGSKVGFKLSSVIDLAVVWQNPQDAYEKIWKLTFADTKLQNPGGRTDETDTFKAAPNLQIISGQPLYVITKAGKVESVYGSTSDTPTSLNMKKGAASLFQFQSSEGSVSEVDASGQCQVRYSSNNGKVTKTKYIASCTSPTSASDFQHPRHILGVNVQSECLTVYTLSGDGSVIQSAEGTESYALSVSIRDTIASSINSRQSLVLQGTSDGGGSLTGASVDAAIQAAGSFLPQSLAQDIVDQQCTDNCQSAADVVDKYRNSIKSEFLANSKSSSAFLKILEAFRQAGKETIVDIVRSGANDEIRAQLLDIVAATQTSASWEAALELLDFSQVDQEETIEKFLVNAAFNSHPSETQIQKIFELIQSGQVSSENIQKTMALSLGSTVKIYCSISEEKCNSQIVKSVLDHFMRGLLADERETRLVSLYALKNVARPSAMPAILALAKDDEDMDLIEIAVDAMSQFDEQCFTPEINKGLNSIYHQNDRRYSNVVRVAAVTLILGKNPSIQDVVNVALSLNCQDSHEFAKFVYSKMMLLSREDTQAAAVIKEALSDMMVYNYAMVRSGGFSNAYRSFLAEMDATSAPFELDMQMTGAGLLRKSTFDVGLDAGNDSLTLMEVLIFSRGLESFFGEDTGDEGESTAGIAVQLLGVTLRPIVFFSGSGDLMSMAWSLGSASSDSSYSAVAGLILLQDHSQRISLQSGLEVEANLQGGLSIDVGGALDFSLWHRTSTTTVYNSGAMSIRGSTRLASPFLNAGISYGADASGHIDFITTVKFSSLPPSFCLQMTQEPLAFKQFVKKFEQLDNSPKKFDVSYSRKTKVLPSSFKLFKENSPMCHEMFGKEEEEASSSWW
ncbi:microsomal triglyceride transfer protein large subunit-like [Lytechinus variegatus]|uniref:microsomal triglyceride transfer protein large subunit-like n=1 Tax=Lytechinus variegatus TaxID=7654 RepID=UPI001BB27633|nr:microsomal triglyceride transfer protein large subunit-like [Lytechinus variegatus]